MNRARLNLVLLALAAGLGLAVFFSRKPAPPGPPLTPLQQDAVTRIRLAHPGAPEIVLQKQGGFWRFVAPVSAEVDDLEVSALIGLADRETQEQLAGAALGPLELAPPKFTLTLNDTAIAFGGVEPLQFRRYVKVGDVVSLIEDPPSAALDSNHADLVAKSLLPDRTPIERIELKRLTLAKDAAGHWTVTPADPQAGADAMQRLADSWKAARAMWNEPAVGATVKGERVKVTVQGGGVHEFVVASREPQFKLHSAAAGVNYVLSKALADELLKLPEPAKSE